jgi:hypothetical protein
MVTSLLIHAPKIRLLRTANHRPTPIRSVGNLPALLFGCTSLRAEKEKPPHHLQQRFKDLKARASRDTHKFTDI